MMYTAEMAADATLDLHASGWAAGEQRLMRTRFYDDFPTLPPAYDALFERAASQGFCLTRSWFETLAQTILNPGERLCLAGVETNAPYPTAHTLLVGRHTDRDRTFGGARTFTGLSNYYSMIFAPLLAKDADPMRVLSILAKAIRARRPRYDALYLQPLDRTSPLFEMLRQALCDAGMIVHPYFHLGNWYEPIMEITSAAYLARRPSNLRNTIRRKEKLLNQAGARLEVISDTVNFDRALASYERIYGTSWKKPEPYPQVIRDLTRNCATQGTLRLGILHLGGAPIAAQIWIIQNHKAILYKLTHDRHRNHLSPGTVLTWRMIMHLLEADRPAEIDFGVGDDPYKSLWASKRRELWGLAAFEPRTVRGALGGLRNIVARKLRKGIASNLHERSLSRSASLLIARRQWLRCRSSLRDL